MYFFLHQLSYLSSSLSKICSLGSSQLFVTMPNVWPFIPCVLQKMARTPNIRHVSLVQNWAQSWKINTPQPKSNHLWKWSGYTSIPNFKRFLSGVLHEIARNPKFDRLNKVRFAPKVGKSTGHDQNHITSGGGQNTSAYRNSGHSFHAFIKIPGNLPDRRADGRTDADQRFVPIRQVHKRFSRWKIIYECLVRLNISRFAATYQLWISFLALLTIDQNGISYSYDHTLWWLIGEIGLCGDS